jgi:hypothetical protein
MEKNVSEMPKPETDKKLNLMTEMKKEPDTLVSSP